MLYVIYALDRPNSTKKRDAARAGHLDYIKGLGDKVLAAGPLLADDKESTIGSMLIVEAEDLEAVKALLGGDPYVRADLFQTIDVHPYRLAISGRPA